MQKKACPCHSGKEYQTCCKLYHEGAIPENALQLMRSRYSAYALNLSDYIIETTHTSSKHYGKNKVDWAHSISLFAKNCSFKNLLIHNFQEKSNTNATVMFTAYLLQNGNDITFTELSFFEKVDGRWLYLDGKTSHGTVLQVY